MKMNKLTVLAISATVFSGISSVQAAQIVSATSGLSTGTLYTFASPSFAANTAISNQFAGITFSPNLYYDGNGGTGDGGCAYAGLATNCITNFTSSTANGGAAANIAANFKIFFATPQTGITFALVTGNDLDTFTLKNGSTTVDTMTINTPYGYGITSGNYYGFTNEAPFTELDITTTNNNLAVFSNLDIAPGTPGSVPEPGTIGLFGMGLVGVAAFARRRLTA